MSVLLQAQITNYNIKPKSLTSSTYMHIKILDSKELSFSSIDGLQVTELSALAYKNGSLYSLSDKGYLYHFEIDLENNKINKLIPKEAYKLKNKKQKNLKKRDRDSEGLVFLDDNLLISFEGNHRVALFSLEGVQIKKQKLHKNLQNKNKYKSDNKGLEAVAYSQKYGILTAPERSLKGTKKKFHKLYTSNKVYKFKARGSITALEFMDKDTVMVLERSFNNLSRQRVITLSSVDLSKCSKNKCKSKLLAKFDSNDGWRVDNFEGLTKVGKNRYLMISDDNDSMFQKTLLVLFEIEDF